MWVPWCISLLRLIQWLEYNRSSTPTSCNSTTKLQNGNHQWPWYWGFMQDDHTLVLLSWMKTRLCNWLTTIFASWYEVPIFLQPSELSLQGCMSNSWKAIGEWQCDSEAVGLLIFPLLSFNLSSHSTPLHSVSLFWTTTFYYR
jgi:hypothetical protein